MIRDLNISEMERVSGGTSIFQHTEPEYHVNNFEKMLWGRVNTGMSTDEAIASLTGGSIHSVYGEENSNDQENNGLKIEIGTGDIELSCCGIGAYGVSIGIDLITIVIPNDGTSKWHPNNPKNWQ